MGTTGKWVIPFSNPEGISDIQCGGKAARLAELVIEKYRIPNGFCVPVSAYERFVQDGNLRTVINLELERKPFEKMRWEEIWDAALRIRSAFLETPIPESIHSDISSAIRRFPHINTWAVRSSAPGEDSENKSFAGLHESFTELKGVQEIIEAVRKVWSSLWSDAALLYRQELSLDPATSAMAVMIQEMVYEDCSGVAFGLDPRNPSNQKMIIEAVPGRCSDLVDGNVEPDRWIVSRSSDPSTEWAVGERNQGSKISPLLNEENIFHLKKTLLWLEQKYGWPVDLEWTGRDERFTVLQVRPITTITTDSSDQRNWYLSLRPKEKRLSALCDKVVNKLIPRLEQEGQEFALENLDIYDDEALSLAIEKRLQSLKKWKEIYWEDFIPFAHGVRRLASYYNDAVKPEDPYEFLGLLKNQNLLSLKRNYAVEELARHLDQNKDLQSYLNKIHSSTSSQDESGWNNHVSSIRDLPGGIFFLEEFDRLLKTHLNISFLNERLDARKDILLTLVWKLAKNPERFHNAKQMQEQSEKTIVRLEQRLLQSVGSSHQEEALEIIRIGRLSWRLRDDDNLLINRLENQLFRAIKLGIDRLYQRNVIDQKIQPSEKIGDWIVPILKNPPNHSISIPVEEHDEKNTAMVPSGVKPRQLIGQPASPGIATGKVRCIRQVDDLLDFQVGEVIVCDAIQPNMTHLVPLASAIVERRGGMLIHGAIIAREMGIPCVNGIPGIIELLEDSEIVTVDGNLGILTIGEPEFNLEKSR